MSLILLHTADVHRDRFDRIAARIAPEARLRHIVRPDWLARAQDGLSDPLVREITEEIAASDTPVLCTCTTIGPVAEAAGATRVDWPMMQEAATAGGPILMVYCLESTRAPSLSLLKRALSEAGTPQKVYPLSLAGCWPLFEAQELNAFADAIAAEVRAALVNRGDVAAVVLAQASMEGAAARLGDLGVPVLASPELALRAVLQQARRGESRLNM